MYKPLKDIVYFGSKAVDLRTADQKTLAKVHNLFPAYVSKTTKKDADTPTEHGESNSAVNPK